MSLDRGCGVGAAKSVLRNIERRRHARADRARDRVMAILGNLDVILAHLPEDAPDDDLREIERIVTALRTADQDLANGRLGAGMQALDLARARVDRLAMRLRDRLV